ncbi:hypothetical protein JOC55_000165 [Paenibacillus sacheonensis]|nr:hypothetical protein [Paenibacillus sacheonensis]
MQLGAKTAKTVQIGESFVPISHETKRFDGYDGDSKRFLMDETFTAAMK